ncbi:MAG: hypothetical protein V2A76_03855 [Planctomycetota bacterium]
MSLWIKLLCGGAAFLVLLVAGLLLGGHALHKEMERAGYQYFDGPRARRWSPDEVRTLLRDSEHEPLAAAVSSINRADHPWLTTLLLDELRSAIDTEQRNRALELVETINWCCFDARESVRVFCWQQAKEPGFGQEITIQLLRAMGDARDQDLLVGLTSASSPTVTDAAREALEDLFGAPDATQTFQVTEPIPGSLPWLLRRLTAMRGWPVMPDEQRWPRNGDELRECPEEDQVRMLRLLLFSCTLPLEEFPGEREFEILGAGWYFLEWWEQPDPDSHFRAVGELFPSALLELSDEIQRREARDLQRQFWQSLDGWQLHSFEAPTVGRLYQSWIDFDMDEPTRFHFLRATTEFDLDHRQSRELQLIASLDLENWCKEDHEGFHWVLRRVGNLLEEDTAGFLARCWHKPVCELDLSAIRAALRRNYTWDPEARKFRSVD